MIFGRLWKYLAAAFAALLPVVYVMGRRGAKKEVKADAAIENEKAQELGRKAVAAGRSSGLSPHERVHDKNSKQWVQRIR